MNEVVHQVKHLVFSKRQEFFRELEALGNKKANKHVKKEEQVKVAWPDMMLFLSDDDYKTALARVVG